MRGASVGLCAALQVAEREARLPGVVVESNYSPCEPEVYCVGGRVRLAPSGPTRSAHPLAVRPACPVSIWRSHGSASP